MEPDRPPVRRARSRALLAALAASAALHLLLLALLPAGPALAPPPASDTPLFIDLRPPEARSPSAPSAPARSAGAPAGSRRAAGTSAQPETAAGSAAAPARAAAPRGPGSGGPSGPDLAAEGLAPSPREAAPDLRVRPPAGMPVEAGDPGSGAGAASGAPALDGWAEDHAGRARVEGGLVHPYHRDVGRALVRSWKAEPALEARGLSGRLSQLGDNLLTFVRVWQRLAEGYAATGAPTLVDGGSDRVKELAGLPPGPGRDALLGAELDRQLRPAFSEGHVALVRVTQAPDGHLLSVALVSPSRDAEVDRAALEAVRTAAGSFGPPPSEALVGREKLVSTWEFRLSISIMPPVPAVGFEFDEVLGLGQLRLPLGRRVWKEVRLVALN